MQTRRGYDSTSAADCPTDGDVYGGYNDGTYAADFADLKARFPNKVVFSIGRFPTSRADFYDVERGLLDPAGGASMAKGNLTRGEFAGIYCNESTWVSSMRAALEAAGILGQVAVWVAWEQPTKDGTIPDYAAGRQFLLDPGLSPGHYDVSNWIAYIPGLDPKPVKPLHPLTRSLITSGIHLLERITRRLAKRAKSGPAVNGYGAKRLRAFIDAADDAIKAARKVLDL